MISKYFDKIREHIENYNHIIENYQFIEKIYSEERGFIEGIIFFIDESKLDFTEVKDIEFVSKIKYHYHFMDKNNNLIFRYDNSKHHKELKTFPHHKHSPENIYESSEPEIKSILSEIESIVTKK